VSVCLSVCLCVCDSVCVCVSFHELISRITRAILTNILCLLPIAVAQSFSGVVTKFQGEGAVLGVFLLIDNSLYSRAFENHTKTAAPTEMQFGLMTRVGLRYHVLDGGSDSPRGRANYWGKP